MIKLHEGNVRLKPSHRRQLMAGLRRSLRLGERLGDFMLTITLRRAGRAVEVRASVTDAAGSFDVRTRQHDWRDALRQLIRQISTRLHNQWLRHAAFA
jgi:hypothetical protein